MSVVRKYEVGGPAPKPKIKISDLLAEGVNELNFTTKSETLGRGVASDWAKLANQENFDEIYSYDPISQQYKVDTNKISDPALRSIDWSGSADPIKTNIFGQYTGRHDKSDMRDQGIDKDTSARREVNSLIVRMLEDKKKKTMSAEPTTPEFSGTKKIGDYSSFYNDAYYGGKGDFEDQWTADMLKIESVEDRKKKIMSHAPEFLSTWKDPSKRLSNWKYEDVENEQALVDAANSGDWNAFTTEAKKIGWRPEDLLKEKTEAQTEEERIAKEAKDLDAFAENLRKQGFQEADIQSAIQNKFTTIGEFKGPQWVVDDVAKNGIVLGDKYGKQIIIGKTGGFYNPKYTDPDSYEGQAYGTYLEHTGNQVGYYDPKTEGYKKDYFTDSYKHSDYRPLEGTVAEYPEWELYGVPRPSGGGNRYIDKLMLKDPATGQTVEVTREGNSYKTLDGRPLTVDIKAYSDRESSLKADHLSFAQLGNLDVFKQMNPQPLTSGENAVSFMENAETTLQSPVKDEFERSGPEMLRKLKWVAQNSTLSDRDRASNLYMQFLKRLQEDAGLDAESLTEHLKYNDDLYTGKEKRSWLYKLLSGETLIGLKEGGIVKYQDGAKMSVGDYIKKYKTETPVVTKKGKTDLRGTLSDASALDIASMGGAAASIIPGLGAIGAGVATAADLLNDIKDDGEIDNWGTHATNVGFIGLSAIGLGGLKSAQAALKASKIARAAGLTAAQADKAARLAKIAAVAKETGAVIPKVSSGTTRVAESAIAKLAASDGLTFKAAGLTTPELTTLKKLNLVAQKATTTSRISNKIVKGVENVKNMKAVTPAAAPIAAPGFLAREFSGTLGVLKGVNPNWAKVGKYAGTGLRGAGLAMGGFSAVNAGHDFVTGGVGEVDVADVKNTAYLLGGLRGFTKMNQLKKAGESLRIAGKEAKSTLQVGDKSIPLTKDLTIPKQKFIMTKASKQKQVDDFKVQLKEAVGEDAYKANFENLSSLKGLKVNTPDKAFTGQLKSQKNSGIDAKTYQRAKAAIEGKFSGNYFSPKWLDKGYFKEGGVIKLESGGSAISGFKGLNLDKLKNFLSVDSTDALNVFNYGQVKRSNERNTRLQKQALEAAITKAPAAPKEYFRVANTLKPHYDKQATQVQNMARRLANTTDLNTAANIQFEGANRARQATEAGIGASEQQIQQGIDKQQQSNRQTQLINLETDYKNKATANDAISRMFLADANKEVADSTALQGLLMTLGQNKQIKDQKLKYGQYYDALTDPNRELKVKEYQQLSESLTSGKAAWEKQKSEGMGTTSSTWDTSPEYLKLTKRLKDLSEELQGFQRNVQQAQYAVQMPGRIGYNAKGGTIEEKKEMLRYANEIKRANQDTERVFKAILKSNELMHKSLIKIFK